MRSGPDSESLAEFYRRFGPAVHRRALSLLRDASEALDVTQETFLAYLEGGDALEGNAAFAVLYQIATYRSVDRLRRRARWNGVLAPFDPGEFNEDAEPELNVPHDGGLRQVEAAQDLALLTRGERPEVLTAALLYFVEGNTTEEIAQVLDLSRKTVGRLLAQFVDRAQKRRTRLDPGGRR
jgi:RNA polymerase sigma factor (sigma-70 family)